MADSEFEHLKKVNASLTEERNRLKNALIDLREELGDCTCDEPEKFHDSKMCQLYFIAEEALAPEAYATRAGGQSDG